MYARVVSFLVKFSQIKGFCDSVNDVAQEVALIRYGFVQHMILASELEKRLVWVASFWRTKVEADQYHEETFPSTPEKLEHLIDSGPVVQYFAAIASDAAQLSSNGAGRRETVGSPEADAQCLRE